MVREAQVVRSENRNHHDTINGTYVQNSTPSTRANTAMRAANSNPPYTHHKRPHANQGSAQTWN